jgi:hypothetical protein
MAQVRQAQSNEGNRENLLRYGEETTEKLGMEWKRTLASPHRSRQTERDMYKMI